MKASRVDPATQRVVKFMPNNPPERGETLVVDGRRAKVKRVKIRWDGPPHWTILYLRVRFPRRDGAMNVELEKIKLTREEVERLIEFGKGRIDTYDYPPEFGSHAARLDTGIVRKLEAALDPNPKP